MTNSEQIIVDSITEIIKDMGDYSNWDILCEKYGVDFEDVQSCLRRFRVVLDPPPSETKTLKEVKQIRDL